MVTVTATILIIVTCSSALPADDHDLPKPEAVRAAVEKALPLILKSTAEYPESRDCFSCHHQAVPVLALASAKERGFAIPAEAISGPVTHTEADLRGSLASYRSGAGQGGGVTRAGYAMLTLEVGGKTRDEVTDAVTEYLLKKDESRDHWRGSSNRPPSEASEFTSTYLALRALTAYGKEGQKDRIAARVRKARRWLEATTPKDTEDRVFRLLALKAASSPEELIRKASDDLLKTRRDDGGWSQLDGGTSDAYATGSALVALHWAGQLATDSPVYRDGLKFLIADQRKDGSWFVASRSKPFQPYFESGFPYGKDQFISMAATSWAVTALSLSCPKN
jgi:squalene cyclase